MGSVPSNAPNLVGTAPNTADWLLLTPDTFKIFKNIHTSEEVEEYTFMPSGALSYAQQLRYYQFRKTQNSNLVGVEYIERISGANICAGNEFYRVWVEHIPLRVKQIHNRTVPEIIYVLREAIIGFQKVLDLFGPVVLTGEMMGINTKGKLKVWLTQSLQENQPSEIESARIHRMKMSKVDPEGQMVGDLIQIVERCLQGKRYPDKLARMLEELKRQSGFPILLGILRRYTLEESMILPERLDLNDLMDSNSSQNINDLIKETLVAVHPVYSKEDDERFAHTWRNSPKKNPAYLQPFSPKLPFPLTYANTVRTASQTPKAFGINKGIRLAPPRVPPRAPPRAPQSVDSQPFFGQSVMKSVVHLQSKAITLKQSFKQSKIVERHTYQPAIPQRKERSRFSIDVSPRRSPLRQFHSSSKGIFEESRPTYLSISQSRLPKYLGRQETRHSQNHEYFGPKTLDQNIGRSQIVTNDHTSKEKLELRHLRTEQSPRRTYCIHQLSPQKPFERKLFGKHPSPTVQTPVTASQHHNSNTNDLFSQSPLDSLKHPKSKISSVSRFGGKVYLEKWENILDQPSKDLATVTPDIFARTLQDSKTQEALIPTSEEEVNERVRSPDENLDVSSLIRESD